MAYNENDFDTTTASSLPKDELHCYCYWTGEDSINNSATIKSLCQDYLNKKDDAVGFSFITGIVLAVFCYFYKNVFHAFKHFYRFSSLRVVNLVESLQIFGSIIFSVIMLPLLCFNATYTEPTREFYWASTNLYFFFMLMLIVFLPIERFAYVFGYR